MHPYLEVFTSNVDKKQYKAVEKVVNELPDRELCMLREIVIPTSKDWSDDKYLHSNIQRVSLKYNEDISRLYSLITNVSRKIAILLEYIAK